MSATLRGWEVEVRGVLALETETCVDCGVAFAMPKELLERRREDKASFYCPNGHSMAFRESEADRLRRLLKNAEATADWERETRQGIERRLTATRGVVTKLRKRATAGACPFGCKRHFVNLERHVASKHRDQQLEGELE
jgi:hypothetical protein